jgi:transposase
MGKTQSQTGNIAIKKEEQEDSKTTLSVDSIATTSINKIAKKKPPIINNRRLPVLQVKAEEVIDTKALLQSEPSSSNSASKPRISQEQINQLVHYIVNDNMSITKAALKVNISSKSGSYYYNAYKNDPEKKIPLPRDQTSAMYTQEQVGNLIRYINDDKMTVTEASAKVNMTYISAYQYYNKYLKDLNHAIPVPQFHQFYTQDQKNEFIGYIINDKMNITAASKKAKMNYVTGYKYYHKYFKEQNPDIPTPSHIATRKCCTQDQISELIGYIVDDKMTVVAASKKANVPYNTAYKYYRQHLNGQ